MAKKYNCTKNGKQYFRISRTVNGKRKDFYGDGEKDALRQYEEYKRQVDLGFDPDTANKKFDPVFKDWLYSIKRYAVRESTMRAYDVDYRNMIARASFATKKLSSIRRIDIEKYATQMHELGYAQNTIRKSLALVEEFFKYLVLSEVLPKNPASGVKPPKDDSDFLNEIVVFSQEDQDIIVERSRDYINGFLYELALKSGLRIGELLALEYGDFTSDGVWVRRNQVYVPGIKDENTDRDWSLKLTPPKSRTSVRFVPLPPEVLTQLEHHRKAQAKMLNGNLSNRVFLTRKGNPFSNSVAWRCYQTFIDRIGIDYKKFHTFRHTYITNCIQAGVDIFTVQELAGHSSVEMTRRYTHISQDHKIEAVKKVFSVV